MFACRPKTNDRQNHVRSLRCGSRGQQCIKSTCIVFVVTSGDIGASKHSLVQVDDGQRGRDFDDPSEVQIDMQEPWNSTIPVTQHRLKDGTRVLQTILLSAGLRQS